MNIFQSYKDMVVGNLTSLQGEGKLPGDLDVSKITVEPPREATHGDMATNAALVLSKQAGMKPRDLAGLLADKIESNDNVDKVDIAGPGFINFVLSPSAWQDCLKDALREGVNYGDSQVGADQKVNVEYVSANPTGPLTAGHARGAIFGDALANLMEKAGYAIQREYYINDAGKQVEILAQSTYLRYREALGEGGITIPDGHYPGEYLKEVGQALAERDGDRWVGKPEGEWLPAMKDFAITYLMKEIKQDLQTLGINQDLFFSENDMMQKGLAEDAFKALESKGLIYQGVLEPPKGKKPDDWEEREQTLFRSTDFGDDVDRPLKKSDGSWTYFANDIAHYYEIFKQGYPQLINVVGADHGGYVKRATAAVDAITDGEGRLDIKLCQIVHIFDNGKPVRMSKRAGTFVTLRDILDAVGKDVMRFIMLTRRNDQMLEFDYAKVTEQSKDNPVFYVQYAHARCRSVLRNALDMFVAEDIEAKALLDADVALLSAPEELSIMKFIATWPRAVEAAADAQEPHRVAFYLQELAALFHSWWNRGRDDASLRFLIEENKDLTLARLALVQAIATTIASGLAVIGVEPVEEMHS